jgi:hypothetical protein
VNFFVTEGVKGALQVQMQYTVDRPFLGKAQPFVGTATVVVSVIRNRVTSTRVLMLKLHIEFLPRLGRYYLLLEPPVGRPLIGDDPETASFCALQPYSFPYTGCLELPAVHAAPLNAWQSASVPRTIKNLLGAAKIEPKMEVAHVQAHEVMV